MTRISKLSTNRLGRSLVLGMLIGVAAGITPARAELVDITLTVSNLAPQNSISFAPLHFAFNRGLFDSFDAGEAATAPIISVAEGGSGSAWVPAFAMADPGAVIGSTGAPLFPGMSGTTATFRVDTAVNPFFTFAAMVIPSNDYFIGNDDPRAYRLFDGGGNLLISEIVQNGNDIWDAGSEAFDPANAAFVQGGDNGLRTPENGVVERDFAGLSGFDGLTTAAGYRFTSGLSANTPIYRIGISASAVPEPESWAMMIGGLFCVSAMMRRRPRRLRDQGALTQASVASPTPRLALN